MKHSPNMSRFLLASLCLHVGLALPWVSAFQLTGHRDTTLNVTLTIAARAAVTPAAHIARSAAHDRAALENRPAAAETAQPPSTAQVPRAADTLRSTDDGSAAAARAQIQAQLLTDLQRYFEYPLLARRHGWQGTVWLSVIVEADGKLDRVRITRGSGYDILDNSAVNALHKVERLVEASRWLSGHALEMDIPVVYRLRTN